MANLLGHNHDRLDRRFDGRMGHSQRFWGRHERTPRAVLDVIGSRVSHVCVGFNGRYCVSGVEHSAN